MAQTLSRYEEERGEVVAGSQGCKSDDEDEGTMEPGVYGKYLRCWEDNVDEC